MRMLAAIAFTGCLCSFAALPCAADETLTDMVVRHQIFQSMLSSQLQGDLAAYKVQAQQIGRQRIVAGKATTSFARAAGYLAPDAYASQQNDPAQRQRAVLVYTQALRSFDELASKDHLSVNDAADVRGLAFTLAYEVYSGGRQASAAQRNDYIRRLRAVWLKDALFQGTSDKRKQLESEKMAIDSLVATAEYAAAVRTNDAALRDTAVRIAAKILQDSWSGPIGGLELTAAGFGDRGERLIREGKASTRVAAVETPVLTDAYAAQLWREFVRYAQSRGIAVDDYGEVQALALAINYNVYTGRVLNDRQFRWALREMKHDIITDPVFQGSSERDKEQMLETIAVNAVSAAVELQRSSKVAPEEFSGVFLAVAQAGGADNASRARAAADRARQAAKKNLEQLFAPRVFDNYVLVDDGFALRSGAQR